MSSVSVSSKLLKLGFIFKAQLSTGFSSEGSLMDCAPSNFIPFCMALYGINLDNIC